MLLMLYLAGSGIGMLASGAFRLVGNAGRAVGSLVTAGASDLSAGDVDQVASRLEASAAAWIPFGAMLLWLIAAIGGGMVGRRCTVGAA